ncbi:hypothetical protein Nepgr_005822 [Nepenthes gracilis]|uniref:Syntaxin 6/10/61 N-terminal domain-containing protein n=1 Tax=Nepenthes gracilis TaxID=150966 RepID=A0AAD3S414_NEPGR|nr:hypothetical protein Nepgr_005822 [Nepenthes gracilis]
MLVANAFDLWQKDAFFSAAEAVQESADILDSAYGMWLRRKREGIAPGDLDELCTALKTSLGTTKWQLEEFERAVRLSYGNCRDENRVARHQQFVIAIESQIYRIENALRESFNEGKIPFRWVNLDKAEQDDLAMFLSGTPGNLRSTKDELIKPQMSSHTEKICKKKDGDCNFNAADSNNFMEVCDHGLEVKDHITINMDTNYVMDFNKREVPGTRDVLNEQGGTTSTRRSCTSSNFGVLKVIVSEEDDKRACKSCLEAIPKGKCSRISSCSCLSGKSWNNQILECFSRFRSIMESLRLNFSSSIQLMLVLMLALFLFVPFLL